MTDSFTPNLTLTLPSNGSDVGAWDVPVNGDFTIVDTAIGGNTTINVVGASGTIALTLTQYRNRILIFSGALTANVNYQIPSAVGGFWFIINTTSGAFTLTISSAGGGSSIVCAQSANTMVLSDGTNILPAESGAEPAAGSNKQVQVNSSGILAGFASMTYDDSTHTLTVTNFAGNITGQISGTVGTTGNPIGYRNIPASANTTPDATDIGKYLPLSSGTTISSGVFSAGDVFLIINTSGSSFTITQGTSVTLKLAGTTTTGSRTLAANGVANLLCTGGNSFIVSGAGVS
jgi:hypothetical protein